MKHDQPARVNRAIINKLNRLCGKTEALQREINTVDNREVYEAVAKAKDNLLEALRKAQESHEGT